MALKLLLDTNAALYFLHGRLARPLPKGIYLFSVITEIELFSYPKISSSEEASIRRLLAPMTRVELTAAVREKTIAIRRDCRMKLPDAVIAASALTHDAVLLSNDAGFERVTDLLRQELVLKPSGTP